MQISTLLIIIEVKTIRSMTMLCMVNDNVETLTGVFHTSDTECNN